MASSPGWCQPAAKRCTINHLICCYDSRCCKTWLIQGCSAQVSSWKSSTKPIRHNAQFFFPQITVKTTTFILIFFKICFLFYILRRTMGKKLLFFTLIPPIKRDSQCRLLLLFIHHEKHTAQQQPGNFFMTWIVFVNYQPAAGPGILLFFN